MIRRLLQPGLRLGRLSFPTHDLINVFHRHADIVEAFKKARAIGTRNFKTDIRTARSADALRHQIDGERRGAVSRDDAGDKRVRDAGIKHDRQ